MLKRNLPNNIYQGLLAALNPSNLNPFITKDEVSFAATKIMTVDSILGNDANDGYTKPKKTLEAAVAAANPIITTFVANTTSGSNSLYIPAGIDATMTVGRKICGAGIPYGTTIIGAGGPNSLTISKNATATATGVSLTVEEIITIKTFGNFEPSSNLAKDGVVWDFGSSVITWGNFTLFNITTVLKHDFKATGGRFVGIHANSYIYRNSSAQNTENIIEFNDMQGYSITTGHLFNDWISFDSTFKMRNCKFSTPFGRLGAIAKLNNYIDIQGYALIGGLECGGNTRLDGNITTPAANYAFIQSNFSASKCNIINANIIGSVYITTRGVTEINGSINGDNIYLARSGGVYEMIIVNGSISGTMLKDGYGTVTINGRWHGNITLTEGTIINNTSTSYFNIAITGNGRFINNSDINYNINGGIMFVSINGANAYFENNGYWFSILNGQMVLLTLGKVVNKGTIEEGFYYATVVQNGGTFINHGTLIQSDVSNPNACLVKSAGTFANKGGNLKTVGSKSPIKCTANTSASRDIYIQGCTTNCDGSTHGVLIAYDGSSYAPNPLILENLNEDTTYTW